MTDYDITGFSSTDTPFKVKKIQHHVDPLSDYEVYIKIKTCGVCFSDLKYYNIPNTILGYEAVGRIIQVVSRFQVSRKIPEVLKQNMQVGPLMCGGSSIFSNFYNSKKSSLACVAVVGIDGLGHLALQSANSCGCNVTTISTS
ncbi:hypothetical protein BDA99DRAFT_561156 [Phascolomyces articulosus]|uniref:Alcohol dehydrogenase-like N-terminal domain-containing protein n=1 Tax=Phascolomyces articulosus TaxID=60185 RepID=A0AAD5K6N2_9FUNG|nr:hypothetical protein BDA99DRAFT_561156 [Phascolomyces articulosus]